MLHVSTANPHAVHCTVRTGPLSQPFKDGHVRKKYTFGETRVIPVVQLLDRWKDSTVVEWPIRYHSITGGEDA